MRARAVLHCLIQLVCLCLMLAGTAEARESPAPVAENGVIDLRGWNPALDGPITLTGDWHVYWDGLWAPDQLQGKSPTGTLAVPGSWSGATVGQTVLTARGTATYRLTVLLPAGHPLLAIRTPPVYQASRLWVDGLPVSDSGKPGPSLETSRPSDRYDWGVFPVGGETAELVLQVSNHRHQRSGMRNAPVFGTPDQITQLRDRQLARDLFMTGGLFLFGLLHILTYIRRRNRSVEDGHVAALWFGLFCLGFALQTLMKGETWIYALFPDLSWEVSVRCRVLLSYVAAPLYVEFCRSLFPREVSPWLARVWRVTFIGLALLILGTSPAVFSLTYGPFGIACLVTIVYLGVRLGFAWRAGVPGASMVVVSVTALGVTIGIDTLTDQGIINAPRTLLAGLFTFLICQAVLLAQRFTALLVQARTLSTDLLHTNQELERTNVAALRFVPGEFLRLLNREQLVLVERGDHVQLDLEILFCDIRKFTSLLEGLTPEEAFELINDYLQEMEPEIYGHGGFINQYLGDCIMALFHQGADEAVAGGVAMLKALDAFNASHGRPDQQIRVGVGINSGPLMMGTIGGMDRLDGGVIGDDVNLAARVEGMTKMYATRFIISESTYDRLAHPDRVRLRELDRVVAKGKSRPVRIYEVLDGLPVAQRASRLATLERFSQGMECYRAGRFAEAMACFRVCVAEVPDDGAAALYVGRCDHFLKHPPDGWQGVTVLDRK